MAWKKLSFSNEDTKLSDADGDTKVDVEESADEDIVRIDAGGTEVVNLDAAASPDGGLHINDSMLIEIIDALGTDHRASGIMADMNVDVNTNGFRNALNMATDGNWIDSAAASATSMPCMALALETGTGTGMKVLLWGFIRDDTDNWTMGGGLIYGATGPGTLTQSSPTGAGHQVQVVGVPITSNIMFLNPSLELVEIAT